MGKISFVLNNGLKTSPEKEAIIYLWYNLKMSKRFNGSTNLKVTPHNWNKEAQTVRNTATAKNRHAINQELNKLKEHFEALNIEIATGKATPTYNTAKSHFDKYYNRHTATPQTLFEFINEFITKSATAINPNSKKVVSKATQQNYKRATEILNDFNNEVHKIDFDNIDLDFYFDFLEWAKARNYSKNYIGKLIKTLKVFLNEATEQGINNNTAFRSKKFAVLSEQPESIYLTPSEIERIYNLDLSQLYNLKKSRDLFIIGCYTGLRFSDFSSLENATFETINGVKYLKMTTQKTQKKVVIPLHPFVNEILATAPDLVKMKISNPVMNKDLKEIGKLANLFQIEQSGITKGGQKRILSLPKFELLTTHTARRSFCTNAYLSGMATIDIMTISGHKSEAVFLNYIKATELQRAVKIAKYDFFKQSIKQA